jgi:lipopolysaccharide biosynthesis glycosyltransferase
MAPRARTQAKSTQAKGKVKAKVKAKAPRAAPSRAKAKAKPARRSGKKGPICISLASSNEYSIGLGVTVRSLLENLKDPRPVHLYVLDGGISEENKQRIRDTVAPFNCKLEIITPRTDAINNLVERQYILKQTYYRLLLPGLLPDVPKLLHLDSDLLVLGNVAELWDVSVARTPLAAVQSMSCPYVASIPGIPNFTKHGLRPETPFLNAGVMLMNLDIWRKEKLSEQIIRFLRENSEDIVLCDNDAYVVKLAGRWKPLEYRWNVEHFAPPRNAGIIHFIFEVKPWHVGCQHPMRERYQQYLARTPWKGTPLKEVPPQKTAAS